MIRCGNCSNPNEDGAVFCANCNHFLAWSTAPSVSDGQEAQPTRPTDLSTTSTLEANAPPERGTPSQQGPPSEPSAPPEPSRAPEPTLAAPAPATATAADSTDQAPLDDLVS